MTGLETDPAQGGPNDLAAVVPDIGRGLEVLRDAVRTLPAGPGVYRMLDAAGEALYVGKAASLKRRVVNYTKLPRLPIRLQRMVSETASLEVVTTHTEAEALLLEANLIKRLRPRFNVLLRDDKSFPYILLTGRIDRTMKTGADPAGEATRLRRARGGPAPADWTGVAKYRGARTHEGEFWGPYASAGAVNRTLNALERAFLLRSCSDGVFSGRTRPCLKYQLRRCSGPCVERVGADDYAKLVQQARNFLAGRSREVQDELAAAMGRAAETREYEAAARYRDRIRALTQVQAQQDINLEGLDLEEADVIAAASASGQVCVQVFFFRGGRNNGNRAYFPRHDRALAEDEVLAAFIAQFYDNKPPPRQVLLSHPLAEAALIGEALSVHAGHRVAVASPQRGAKRRLVEHALANARDAIARRLAESATQRDLLERVATAFGLEAPPRRIEVYDNSHVAGRNAVGGMIVAGPEGFRKNAYRKFNIRGARAVVPTAANDTGPGVREAAEGYSPGDDYAMMREVLSRRFARALEEESGRDDWPDLVLIDGGAGQLAIAEAVLAELGIDDLPLVAIAKGPDRDAGRERFFMPGREAFSLPERDPALYFLQRLRDEAHRFAIGAHRARRSQAIMRSPLDEIAGIGARRKKSLLTHFGSAREVSRAGLDDLARVPGISATVAKRIYDHFHGGG
ncbi:MAG: excinuclease ABC subunit UvrC [Alphaproteobacteria bacterium]|nr:excinuclease ABC subunit UvrC [Alphaproteobacteria bacterium]